ncbi:MAG: hypothetical protein AAGM46_27430, partial [Cyanobacteria bacterium J06582_2]
MGPKGKKRFLDHEQKLKVIKLHDEGKGGRAIGRIMGMNESSVRRILSKKDELLKSAQAYGCSGFDSRSRPSHLMVKMERYLALYLSRKESEGVPVDKKQIKEKALVFYRAVCQKEGSDPSKFVALNEWLCRFLERKKVKNIRLTGEIHSADEVAAKEYPAAFRQLLEEKGGYHPDCIYNMDEAGLYYKKMPNSTYLSKSVKRARGRKPDKSRVTVLFCVNQSGTHKVKPLVVHTARHPRCFKNLNDMADCPGIYWRSSKKAWITSQISKDWLVNCFVPEARRQCRRNGHEFKVVLTMDNCPAHPQFLVGLHPAVEVVFLPPNTTSLIQPLDQEIISNVKAKYQALVFRQLRSATDDDAEVRLIMEDDRDSDEPDDPEEDPEEDPDDIDPVQGGSRAISLVTNFWKKFTV